MERCSYGTKPVVDFWFVIREDKDLLRQLSENVRLPGLREVHNFDKWLMEISYGFECYNGLRVIEWVWNKWGQQVPPRA